jgi:hypothetical protein
MRRLKGVLFFSFGFGVREGDGRGEGTMTKLVSILTKEVPHVPKFNLRFSYSQITTISNVP